MSNFWDWLTGSPDKLKKLPTGTKQQENVHNNVLQQALNMSQSGGGYDLAQQYFNNILGPNQQDAFNQFSAPYLQQFQEQMLPQIAERFAGAGALSSSGFGQALGGATSDFQAQLAQLFSQLQQQSAGAQTNQYNQLTQQGLNYQPYAYNNQKGSTGFLGNLATGIGGNIAGPLTNNLAQGITNLFKPKGTGGLS